MQKKIKISQCECGSIYAPVYWNEKKQKFVCQTCYGIPDDSEFYKKKEKPPWYGKVDNCSNACTFIDDCWNCWHITEELKEKYKIEENERNKSRTM